jgi:hypothetical protein
MQSEGASANKRTGHPVAPVRTPQKQTALFESYFASLDQLRREAEDPALTARYVRSLQAVDPAFSALKQAHLDGVTCGSGLCRVDLTFPSSAQVDQGKTELMFQVGPLSSSASVYSDLKRPHVAGYFAAPGHRLPPFPGAPK